MVKLYLRCLPTYGYTYYGELAVVKNYTYLRLHFLGTVGHEKMLSLAVLGDAATLAW